MGIDPDAFNDKHRETDRSVIPIWPDMRAAFALFCDASWSWVSLGDAGAIRTNINRVELEASARGLGIELTPAIYCDVRAMEGEAVAYWSRKR